MNSYDKFAENLRLHVEKQKSIAAVCRATGINRTQFNKYLAGTSLPNARNMRKICKELGVQEDDLLHGQFRNEQRPTPFSLSNNYARALLGDFSQLPGVTRQEQVKSVFTPGLYHVYGVNIGAIGYALRFVVRISEDEGNLSFVRISRFNRRKTANIATRGKHFGIVLPSRDDETFLGRNALPPYQLSAMNFNRWAATAGIHVGLMLTRTSNNMLAYRMLIARLPNNVSFRDASRDIGLIALDDPTVPRSIKILLKHFEIDGHNAVLPPTPDDLPPELARETGPNFIYPPKK